MVAPLTASVFSSAKTSPGIAPVGGRRKSKVPPFHSRRCREMLPGIFVGENVCAVLMHPFVAVAMVEMPVRINEMLNGFGTQFCQSVGDFCARSCIARINDQFAVRSG